MDLLPAAQRSTTSTHSCLLYTSRYRDGLTTYLDVATAETTELNIEFGTVQLRGQQLVASVTLVKSLGGGWQESKQQ